MKTLLGLFSAALVVGLIAWYLIVRSRAKEDEEPTEENKSPKVPEPTSPKAKTDPFVTGVLRGIAEKLSPERKIEVSDLTDQLILWHTSGKQPDSLIGILKIEYSFVKKTASLVTLAVRVALSDGDKVKLITFDREMSWENLPQEVRSDFIRHGGKELHFVLCETSPSKAPETTTRE
jgi:hypothetical protein